MEEATLHIGRKIGRIREQQKWKQERLANALGVTQQAVSKMEQAENLEDAQLERVAKALGVTVDDIKNYTEPITNIQNNYEGSNPGVNSVSMGPATNNQNCTINNVPDKWLEALEEVKRLNEEIQRLNAALLKEKDEKIALLQQLLESKK